MSSKTKAPVIVLASKLSVVDQAGKHLYWVDEDHARELISDRKVECLRTKRKIRGLRLLAPVIEMPARPKLHAPPYSHRRETEDNVGGCWTLVHIPNECQDLFISSKIPCSWKKAA